MNPSQSFYIKKAVAKHPPALFVIPVFMPKT